MKLRRFTLQTLFIAVTLIAAFLGWRLWGYVIVNN